MRTAGQGQAAVPREREHRRRVSVPAWAHHPGPRDKILWTVTIVERYPDAVSPAGKRHPVCHGAFCGHGFFLRKKWECVSPEK